MSLGGLGRYVIDGLYQRNYEIVVGGATLIAALTIYGELRSLSATIEALPPLRWLDSLGRVKNGMAKR